MDVLLTGATGFIGKSLLSNLEERHHLYALTRQNNTDGSNISWINGDLSCLDISLYLPDNVDAIVYLAQSNKYRSFPDNVWDIFNINISSVLSLLEYARVKKIKKFIFASTANVYELSHYPINENNKLDMTSFYARSKRIAEMLVESYSNFFRTIVFRFFTVYGPGQNGMLIPSLVEKVKTKMPVQLYGNEYGLELSPIFVSDVVKVLITALENDDEKRGFDVFNVGGDERLSIRDIAILIGKQVNIKPEFEYIPGEYKGGWIADSTKLKEVYGLGEFLTFEDVIAEVIKGDKMR